MGTDISDILGTGNIQTPEFEHARDNWIQLYDFLSYFGFQKDRIEGEFDDRFGKNGWIAAHSFGGKVIPSEEAYSHYEDAFYHHLKNNPNLREWITKTASDVFDIQPSNVDSGLDYRIQECGAKHLQDISVRRALTRLKLEDMGKKYDPANLPKIPIFEGDHLVQIRDKKSEGFPLNPGQVPYHNIEDAIGEPRKDWWLPNSAEDVYQRNKVMLVNPDALGLKLAMATKDKVYFSMNKRTYFTFDPKTPHKMTKIDGKALRKNKCEEGFKDCTQITYSPILDFQEMKDIATQVTHHEGEFESRYEKKHMDYEGFIERTRRTNPIQIGDTKLERGYDLEGYTLIHCNINEAYERKAAEGKVDQNFSPDINKSSDMVNIASGLRDELDLHGTYREANLAGSRGNGRTIFSFDDNKEALHLVRIGNRSNNVYMMDILVSKNNPLLHDTIVNKALELKRDYC